MTGADLLDRLNILDNELDVSSGGAAESRALTALDMAQDLWQAVAAAEPKIGQTHQTVTTTANEATTTWPSGLMRIDRMFKLDTTVTPNRQAWEIDVLYETGGQDPAAVWPLYLGFPSNVGGAPMKCYAEKESYLNWGPFPDAVHSVRIYGLWARTAITSRAITFGWPREVSIPLVAVAARILAMGVDDPSEELKAFATETYTPVVKANRRFTRTKPEPRKYRNWHTT